MTERKPESDESFSLRDLSGAQPLWIPLAVLGSLLVVSLVVQLTLAWMSYSRILPVDRHVVHLEKLQSMLTTVEKNLALPLPEGRSLPPALQARLQEDIQTLLDNKQYLANDTEANLHHARMMLEMESEQPRQVLLDLLTLLRETFRAEASAHQSLTHDIYEAALFEVEIGVVTLIAIPVSALVLLLLMRRRIFLPLRHMGLLMRSLSNREYRQITAHQADPMLKSLVDNYNQMVVRLQELETEHVQSEQKLEAQVEHAVRTLIEQQHNVATTERLAALGEVMARLAHELRNPLAGVRMACSNLKKEMEQDGYRPDHAQRLDMVGDEIDRVIDLLNGLLDQARHKPEPLRDVALASLVDDLLSLSRYQVPSHIKLVNAVTQNIVCRLPDARLRQALLNLIINAQQAMGEEDGEITISAEHVNQQLTISVCDQGPGFPESMLQADILAFNSMRDGGTGLGLSMVQRFVRNQGGRLILKNRQPRGACVTLQLNCIETEHA